MRPSPIMKRTPLRTIRRARLPGYNVARGCRTPALYGLRIVREGATEETSPNGCALAFPVRMRVFYSTGKVMETQTHFISDEGWVDFGGEQVQVELWAHREVAGREMRATIEYSIEPGPQARLAPPESTRCMYDSGVVANGAVINSGFIILRECRELLFIVHNGDTAARNLTEMVNLNEEDGDWGATLSPATTIRAVVAGATEFGAYGPGANATGNAWAIARLPPTKAAYVLGATECGNARLTILGR